jgi:protein-tyrosine phosphatase
MPEQDLIVVICTANVCRSPMAEKLLQHALAAEGEPLDQLQVVSAGVAAGYGDPASENSVAALKKVKLDIADHKSQPLTDELIDRAFAIFGMTDSHLDALRHYHKNIPGRVHLLRGFMDESEGRQIPDPIGQDFDAYCACRDAMIEAIPSVVAYLKNEYKKSCH